MLALDEFFSLIAGMIFGIFIARSKVDEDGFVLFVCRRAVIGRTCSAFDLWASIMLSNPPY